MDLQPSKHAHSEFYPLSASREKKNFDIERALEEKKDLSHLSIKEVYLEIKKHDPLIISELLPLLSKTQRGALIDLDLWKKDCVEAKDFELWIKAYRFCPKESLKHEFATSQQFLLYLKNRFTIHTFDVEDPLYPDHDYYFLTDDNLLLFEYDENFDYVDEVKDFIRVLYMIHGVENAYTYLFKMVCSSYEIEEEEEYIQKKSRLSELGFVDYYDSLEFFAPFHTEKELVRFIDDKLKNEIPGQDLSSLSKGQIQKFSENLSSIHEELLQIDNPHRYDYLNFNYTKLINAGISYTNALNQGSLAISKIRKIQDQKISLGFSYLSSYPKRGSETKIFKHFDFKDLQKIGHSLVQIELKKIKNSLKKFEFESEENEKFLGTYWGNFLDESFLAQTIFKGKPLSDVENFLSWKKDIETFISSLPYIKKIFETFIKVREGEHIQKNYYLNYDIESIDFEAIILSFYFHFILYPASEEKNEHNLGLGVPLKNFKEFFQKKNSTDILSDLKTQSFEFFAHFGLKEIPYFESYFSSLIDDHLGGISLGDLSDEEFKHIGGPILLSI